MRHLTLALSLALLMAAGSGLPLAAADTTTDTSAASTINKDDSAFLQDALQGGWFEIKTSELALKRIPSGPEHDFAQKMVDDHTAVDDELKALAKSKGVTLPDALDEHLQKKVDELGKQDDKNFPEAYMSCQAEAHKKAVKVFKSESEDAKDVDVKAFAAKHLPHLEAHLDQAKELKKQM